MFICYRCLHFHAREIQIRCEQGFTKHVLLRSCRFLPVPAGSYRATVLEFSLMRTMPKLSLGWNVPQFLHQ